MKYALLLVLVPALAAAQVKFKIKLDYDNASCVNGNVCTSEVFRAICTGTPPNQCPSFSTQQSQFLTLPAPDSTNSTQTVTGSSTHFTYIDQDKASTPLQYSTTYAYAVRNTYTANPSKPSDTTQIALTTPTGVHRAVINWSNPSCRTSSPCTLQIYRTMCSGNASTCVPYAPGDSHWKALPTSSGLTSSVTAQGTTWQYNDQDMLGSTTYAWVATASYTGFTSESAASQAFSGTTAVGKSTDKENQQK